MNVMFTYLRDMEYFAAYGETIRDINKIFTNKQVRDAIELYTWRICKQID